MRIDGIIQKLQKAQSEGVTHVKLFDDAIYALKDGMIDRKIFPMPESEKQAYRDAHPNKGGVEYKDYDRYNPERELDFMVSESKFSFSGLFDILSEQHELDEVPSDFQFFTSHASLEQLRDALAKNRMISVAYVKKDGSVRHMLVRRHLAAYVPSDAPKTDAQMNIGPNNDVKRVIDMSFYRKTLKELRTQGMGDEQAKAEAAKKAWRTINLKEVLGFLVGGNFVDLRGENDILARYGQGVYDSLTPGMISAMQAEDAVED